MGVTGLWQIVQPCARPIKIETLNRKRLAVDASIWIYQFLKAVRDKEGNALRNSHVVGFFRRICKLLFFGIKPVFVFDGGAPALKRQTISARKSRREGRREDAVRTAGKLLAVQMQRRAEEDEARRKARNRSREEETEEAVPDENLVYAEEVYMTQQERQQNRKFRKKDAYHLPDLDVSVSDMGGPNDPRIMSLEDLQAYARQFDTGEDINVYDFSKIDYDSAFFTSLPASDRYNILNAARLRSRLRMGHSKEQLESMFPDRMAFSKFQIERVTERNELTQRLMHLNGYEDATFGANGSGRVAGEKGREYVLIKNDGVEGGWALGVISDEGKADKPIDVDAPDALAIKKEELEVDEDEDFEDIPIEGLNRLPKISTQAKPIDPMTKQRKAFYRERKLGVSRKPKRAKPQADGNSLFVQESDRDEAEEEQASAADDLSADDNDIADEDEELQRALAMSLEREKTKSPARSVDEEDDSDVQEVFHQSAALEQKPLPSGSGRSIANIVNRRAYAAAPESREVTSFGVPVPKPDESDEDEAMDLQAALAESRRTKRKPSPIRREIKPPKHVDTAKDLAKKAGFSGPLPFEKLDLGSSLLGKKKMQERSEEAAGGFVNPELAKKEAKKAEPLPPWFDGDIEKDINAQKAMEKEDRQKAKEFSRQFVFQERGPETLRRLNSTEVIDLEQDEPSKPFARGELIDLEADESMTYNAVSSSAPREQTVDFVEDGRVATPEPSKVLSESGTLDLAVANPADKFENDASTAENRGELQDASFEARSNQPNEDDEQMLDWSESESGRSVTRTEALSPKVAGEGPMNDGTSHQTAAQETVQKVLERTSMSPRSPSPEFEEVTIPDAPLQRKDAEVETDPVPSTMADSNQESLALYPDDDEFDDFSDPEELEMLKALTMEAEEHARFASSLNNKSQAQNIQEYEQELRQLRNQQKKDRRDADEVTHVMITECQQLLSLFGLPYVTAPMEAEAQCAELVRLGLVDGIVTDDSDCFLFGGTRIYKNMFNQAKYVECYLSSDLEKEFDLTRDKMIAVAQLLGSDYTEGLNGVGPVTALEIISEFQNLEKFRDWFIGVQMNQVTKSDDAGNSFRLKFRRNASKIFLPTAFPDPRVDLAYVEPEVDSDPQPFQWGVPDLDALRSYLMATIGWSQERTDEILLPVIKDMNRRMDEGTQANITAFFDGTVGVGAATHANGARGEGFAPRKRADGSKRMGSALKRMAERARTKQGGSTADDATGEISEQSNVASSAKAAAPKAGKRRKESARANVAPDEQSGSDDDDAGYNEMSQRQLPAKKRTRTGRAKK
jgi:DNA excision repair protein ERCC-5